MKDRVHNWSPCRICLPRGLEGIPGELDHRPCARCGEKRHHPNHHITLVAPSKRGPFINWTRIFR